MAAPRETLFNPSSPRSSTGHDDSYKNDGTPDTRLTAFSPEEGSARSSKYYNSLSLATSDSQASLFSGKPSSGFLPGLTHAGQDPFTASQPSQQAVKHDQRLSPLAIDFQPFSVPFGGQSQQSSLGHQRNDGPFDLGQGHTIRPASRTSGVTSDFTRYIVIESSGSLSVNTASVNQLLTHLENNGYHFKGKRYIQSSAEKVYIRFTHLQDALMLFANVRQSRPEWHVDFISPVFWRAITSAEITGPTNEGQVMLVVDIGRECMSNPSNMEIYLYRLLAAEAEIYSFVKQGNSSPGLIRILIEFYNVDAATVVINKYNGFAPPGEGFTLHLSPHNPGVASPYAGKTIEQPARPPQQGSLSEINSSFQKMGLMTSPPTSGGIIASGRSSFGNIGMPLTPHVGMYPHPLMYHTPSPASTHYVLDTFPSPSPSPYHLPAHLAGYAPMYQPASAGPLLPYQPGYSTPKTFGFTGPDVRRQNAQRVARSSCFNAAGNHNHVEISRIRDGIDVRTTIMLRNIPNKVDQAMLKRIVDESSWGKYDFMYLRIDFANDCNVGYAFINFVDPLDIIDFVEARDHQRWNCFKSDKVAEISYATIQGKDCLVQKFRNSSVMLEAPHYRPKLYFTTNGPHPELAGQEEPFPGPDNQSKMKRSCENAEHVGLFTPNAGQHLRDEQRRRRSQYDRGTRLAALEEYDYENNFNRFIGQ